jgi:proteasome lid subunit RPN8/RPN11
MIKDILSEAAIAAMTRHALDMAAKSPAEEAVGLLINGEYVACHNSAAEPDKGFRLEPEMIGKHRKGIEAIIHSHPGGPACPSAHDMRQQQATGLPWIIMVTPVLGNRQIKQEWFSWDGAPRLDMTAGYRHGISDCYGLIRGWYHKEKGVVLPDYPREWEWWRGPAHSNLYLDYFADAGFVVVDDNIPQWSPQRGDVFLAAIRSPVPNHAGVYLGNGLILHHLAGAEPAAPHRLPTKEPAERWKKFITIWLRHRHATSPSN